MASGDTLTIFTPLHNEPPSSNPATLDIRNQHPVLDFDATTNEDAATTSNVANGMVRKVFFMSPPSFYGLCDSGFGLLLFPDILVRAVAEVIARRKL